MTGQDPVSPSWRSNQPVGRTPRPSSDSGSGAAGSWRQPHTGTGQRPSFWRDPRWARIRQGLWSTVALLLTGAGLIYLSQLPGCTRTEIIVATVASYDDCALPAQPYASRDERAWLGVSDTVSVGISKADDFERTLNESIKRLDKKSVLILFVSARGGYLATGEGEHDQASVLLWSDSRGDEPSPASAKSVYRLEKVLDLLEKFPPERPKLLLLDLQQTSTDWRLGQLENWWLDDFLKLVQKRRISRLTVLSSCGRDEHSWSGSHLGESPSGRSAFVHFLTSALQDEAGRGRRRISLQSLCEQVQFQTNQWVIQNRNGSGQHPVLWTNDKEIARAEISLRPRRSPTPADAATPQQGERSPAELWKELDQCWQEREQLSGTLSDPYRADAAYQFDPLSWRALTRRLLRAEEFRRARAVDLARQEVAQARILLSSLRGALSKDILVTTAADLGAASFVTQNVIRRLQGKTPGAETLVPPLPEDALEQVCLQQFVGSNQERMQDQVAQAVKLRSRGEEVAAGPLSAFMVSRSPLAEADRLRRFAEDRLFIGDSSEKVTTLQTKALEEYEQTQRLQRTFHQMWCLRNRLLAELPEIGAWAAFRAPASATEYRQYQQAVMEIFLPVQPPNSNLSPRLEQISVRPVSLEQVTNDVLILQQFNRELDRELSNWLRTQTCTPEQLVQFEKVLTDSGQKLDRLTATIRTLAQQAQRKLDKPQWTNWRDIDELLSFPELSSQDRMRLNRTLENYSGQLQSAVNQSATNRSGQSLPAAAASSTPSKSNQSDGKSGTDQADQTDERPSRARWHALWAIQTLSQGTSSAALRSDDPLWQLWRDLPGDHDPKFREQATVLGDQIRKASLENQSRVKTAHRHTVAATETRVSESTERQKDVAEVLRQKIDTERLARFFLDDCTAFELAGKFNPGVTVRACQFKQLLLTQAERYTEDFWKDWYGPASTACLQAAAGIKIPELSPLQQQVEQRIQQRNPEQNSRQVTLEADSLVFGSEDTRTLSVTVSHHNLPAGEARFTLDVPQGRGLQIQGTAGRTEIAFPSPSPSSSSVTEQPHRQEKAFGLTRDSSVTSLASPVTASATIFYRGHSWKKTVSILPSRLEGILLSKNPLPSTSQILVEGYREPAILFILDCSGSMSLTVDQEVLVDGKLVRLTRLQHAVNALNNAFTILKQQTGRNLPRVGLIVYGNSGDPKVAAPPRISRQILPINQQFQMLLVSLQNLKAEGDTPLLRSLEMALDEFGQEGEEFAESTKTIIAITDGVFSEPAPYLEAYTKLNSRLKQAQTVSGVNLVMIGFQLGQLDKKDDENRLELMKQISTFQDALDPVALNGAILDAVKVGDYSVVPRDSTLRTDESRTPVPLGATTENLPPGNYQIRFRSLPGLNVQLKGGEFLRFQAGRNRFSHPKPADTKSSTETTTPDVALVCRSYRIDASSKTATLLVSLVNREGGAAIETPVEMDLEVRSAGDVRLHSQRVSIQPGETVPTWKIQVQDWPASGGAVITATWKNQSTRHDWGEAWKTLRADTLAPVAEGLPLRLLQPPGEAGPGRYQLEWKLDVPRESFTEDVLQNLRRSRFELVANGKPLNLKVEKTLYPTEGKLTVTFEIPSSITFDPDWEVRVTAWKSLQRDAEEMIAPLRIEKTDLEQ